MKDTTSVLDTLIYTGGYIAYLLSQWIVSIVIVNITGLEDAGYFGVAMTLTSVFYMVASYGIRSYQISDLKPLFSDESYIAARVLTTVIGFLLCMSYSILSGYDVKQIIIIGTYMLFKCCEALYDVLHGIWQKRNKLKMVGKSLLIKAFINALCFLVPYVVLKDLIIGLLSMFISAVVLLGADYGYTIKCFVKMSLSKVNSKSITNLLKATFVMMLLIMCAPTLVAIPRIVLERTAGREILGIYTSLATPTTLISAFASTVFLPLIPKYTVAYEEKDGKKIYNLIATSSLIMVGIGIMASIAIVFLGYWAVNLVYGEVVAEYYQYMHGVVLSVVLSSIIMCLNNLLTGVRKLNFELGFMLSGCIVCLIVSMILVPKYSMIGAISAAVIAQLVQVGMEMIYIIGLVKKLKTTE